MSYYDHQQQPPVGVPPPQGMCIYFNNTSLFFKKKSFFILYFGVVLSFIELLNDCFVVNTQQGIQQRTLILHQGTLHKVTLHQGTLLKGMLHSTFNNLLLDKRPVFLKDGKSLFLFLANICVAVVLLSYQTWI